MIKTPETKISNYSVKIDDYLNRVYELRSEFTNINNNDLEELTDSLSAWRTCMDEIELSIKSKVGDSNSGYEIDNENKEVIIY